MAPNSRYDDLGPGLHTIRDDKPLELAKRVAVELDADLCTTVREADAVLVERFGLSRADAAALSEARSLAGRLGRAMRISDRTRDRAVVEVGQRLASRGGGLAVHPTTIRDRAAAVDHARQELAAAEQALLEPAPEAAAVEEQAATDAALAAAELEQGSVHREAEHMRRVRSDGKTRRVRSIAVLLAVVVGGDALYLLTVPWWACVIPVVAGVAWVVRDLRPRSKDEAEDLQAQMEASSLLSQIGTSTDELFSARRAQSDLEERVLLREARRDQSLEELRVAERAWKDLAGEFVGTDELDEVIRRYDPQHEDARLLAGETVGVRTAEAVVHQLELRWRALWDAFGIEVPLAAGAEGAIEELAARLRRAIVLVGMANVRGDELARVARGATVLAVREVLRESDAAG